MIVTEPYFPRSAVYYTIQGSSNFEPVVEILKCDHSNKSYGAPLFFGAVYYTIQGDPKVLVCESVNKIPKLLNNTFKWCC